jgi:hypothetical protein
MGSRRETQRVVSATGRDGDDALSLEAKHGGLQVNDAKRLRALEGENRQLKRLVADQALNLQVVKDLREKKW